MRENLGAPQNKLVRVRKLLAEQQQRIDRHRELVAQLESDGAEAAVLRSARETLRQMIKAYEAMLHEAYAHQGAADILRHDSEWSESLSR